MPKSCNFSGQIFCFSTLISKNYHLFFHILFFFSLFSKAVQESAYFRRDLHAGERVRQQRFVCEGIHDPPSGAPPVLPHLWHREGVPIPRTAQAEVSHAVLQAGRCHSIKTIGIATRVWHLVVTSAKSRVNITLNKVWMWEPLGTRPNGGLTSTETRAMITLCIIWRDVQ